MPPLARTRGSASAAAAGRALRLRLISGKDAAEAVAAEAPAAAAEAAASAPATEAAVVAAAKPSGAAREAALYRLTLADDPAVKATAVEALLVRPDASEFLAGARLAEQALRALAEVDAGGRAALFARAAAALGDVALATRFRAKAGEAGGFELALTDALIGLGARRRPTEYALAPLLVFAGSGAEATRTRAQQAVLLVAAAGSPLSAEARPGVVGLFT